MTKFNESRKVLATWRMETHICPCHVLPQYIETSKARHHNGTDAHHNTDREYNDRSSPVFRNRLVNHVQTNEGSGKTKHREKKSKVEGYASKKPKLENRHGGWKEHHERTRSCRHLQSQTSTRATRLVSSLAIQVHGCRHKSKSQMRYCVALGVE